MIPEISAEWKNPDHGLRGTLTWKSYVGLLHVNLMRDSYVGILRGNRMWDSYVGIQDLFCHQVRAGTVFSGSQSKNFEMKSTSTGLKRHND